MTSGRPLYSEEQYENWLNDMRPSLELGCSLNRAIEKSGLERHRTTLYEKYKLNDWFTDKIDIFRSQIGENVNEAFARLIEQIHNKLNRGERLTKDDIKVLIHVSTTHRSCQPFFFTRYEARGKKPNDIQTAGILNILEADYTEFQEESKPITLLNQQN